jgi:hypothetical protein
MSTNQSHATQSAVPSSIQKNAPEGVERALPDSVRLSPFVSCLGPVANKQVHNTDTAGDAQKSHATGPSKVPETIQKLAPKGLEEALPESIHPTNKI